MPEPFKLTKVLDRQEDVKYAMAMVGSNAHPTGRLREVLFEDNTKRLEQEWVGEYGRPVWLPIPLVSVKS
jgi:hypothetical protein